MYGASHYKQLLYFLPQLTGDGQEQMMVCMNQTGQSFPKHPKSAMSWYHASVKRDVWGSVNARRLHLNVQLCVHVKESVHKIIDMYSLEFYMHYEIAIIVRIITMYVHKYASGQLFALQVYVLI